MTRSTDLRAVPVIAEPEPFREEWLPLAIPRQMKALVEQIWAGGQIGAIKSATQSGKSMLAEYLIRNCGAYRADTGKSRLPIGHAVAGGRKQPRLLLHTLALSLGGPFYAREANLLWKCAWWMRQLGTTLVIVEDAQDLTSDEWIVLVKLQNVAASLRHSFAVALLGISKPGLFGIPGGDDHSNQMRQRLTDFWELPGHSGEQIKDALKLLTKQYAPKLHEERFHEKWQDVRRLLKVEGVDPTGEIHAKRLVQVVLWCDGYRQHDPRMPLDNVIKAGVGRLVQGVLAGTAHLIDRAEETDEEAAAS